MSNKKSNFENWIRWVPPILIIISAIWYVAEMDKRITVIDSKITVVKESLLIFYNHQLQRNKAQDENLRHFERNILLKIHRIDDKLHIHR